MKRISERMVFALALIAVSIAVFVLQHFFFHNPQEAGFLFFQDLGFLPVQIVLVTLILEKILAQHEKKDRLEKLNILISEFYSEAGREAIHELTAFVENRAEIASYAQIDLKWDAKTFSTATAALEKVPLHLHAQPEGLSALRDFLLDKKHQILVMFENPSLLENNRFTEMLWALYHLTEELKARESFVSLPKTDLEHLAGDMKRAYRLLVVEWLHYSSYIKARYPYLFSLSVRQNPFGEGDVVIKE